MYRPSKKKLPVLIDENMLERAVMSDTTEDEAAIVKKEGIRFDEVVQLSLGNKDIVLIAYMWDFTSLEKLYLGHNLIMKIEGLHCLFNLKWLDLSFNKIEKIEGLESLRKLEALDLSNNRISVLENMDTLEKLNELCIGNNEIGQMDNVFYLKKFKELESLNLSGNPVSREEEYRLLILTHFPKLICLDSAVIGKDEKKEAFIKFEDIWKEMRSEADQEDDFVRFLNECRPSGSMFKEDPESERLFSVFEMAQVMKKCETQAQELFTQIISLSLAEYHRRETEVNSFMSVHTAAMEDYEKKASELLQQNLQRMMELLQETDSEVKENISKPCKSLMEKETHVSQTEIMVKLRQIRDPDLLKDRISHCINESSQLSLTLIEVELLYVNQIEGIIKLLDRNLTNMIGNFTETAEGMFTQCRDVEDEYYDKVRNVAGVILEKVAKDEVGIDMTDAVIMLFTDRDTVMDALDTGHANHLRIINDMETQLLTRVTAWKTALIKGIQEKELLGNQTRLSDFHAYTAHLREELENDVTSVKDLRF